MVEQRVCDNVFVHGGSSSMVELLIHVFEAANGKFLDARVLTFGPALEMVVGKLGWKWCGYFAHPTRMMTQLARSIDKRTQFSLTSSMRLTLMVSW